MSYDARVMATFFETISKIAVSDEEAIQSARVLSEPKRSKVRRYVDAGVVGGTLAPAVELAGSFAEHAGNAKKDRLATGLANARLSKGQLAKAVTKGVLGGAVVRAGQEGLQLHRAKDTYNRFLQETT